MVERIVSALVILLVALAIGYGWLHRHALGFSPDHGFGYALGIIGGVLMLILLAYPVRKRSRTRRAVGSVGFWFRFHMFLGLVGPMAILFHSRFTWGSLNAAVALGAMIIVASSGLVGRFLYSRVHRGYSGRKLELRSLKDEMDDLLAQLDPLAELPAGGQRIVRGHANGPIKVALPDGYLADRDDASPPSSAAEMCAAGGG